MNKALSIKKIFINKYINVLDVKDKYELVKILLIYNIKFTQTTNGVYTEYTKMNDKIVEIIYNFINTHI